MNNRWQFSLQHPLTGGCPLLCASVQPFWPAQLEACTHTTLFCFLFVCSQKNTIMQNPDGAWRNYIPSSKLGWSEQKPSLSHLPTSSTASGCSFPSSCSRTASSSACRIHRSSCSLTQTELDCDLNWYTRQSTAVAREPNTLTVLLPPLLLGWKPPAESWGQRAEEDDFLGYTKLDHHSAFGSSFCHSLSCPGTRL